MVQDAMNKSKRVQIYPKRDNRHPGRPQSFRPPPRFPDISHKIHRCSDPTCLINGKQEW